MAADHTRLTGKQKAAILMTVLGPQICADVFKHLSDEEIEQLTHEITNLREVDHEATRHVLQESHTALIEPSARRPFAAAREIDPSYLLHLVHDEHPQTIALILAHVRADQAAHILEGLPPKRQVDVASRLANLDQTPSEVLAEVDTVLQERISASQPTEYIQAGGVDAVLDVLGYMAQPARRSLLEELEVHDPGLAYSIQCESIPFDAIERLDDDDVRRIVVAVKQDIWAVALKTAGEGVTERVLRSLSRRSAERLRTAIDDLGPVRLGDVEKAQQEVVRTMRDLQRSGEILLVRVVDDEIIV